MPAGIDVAEASRILGVSAVRVRQLIDGGDLAAERVGRFWLVDPSSVRQRADVRVTPGRPYTSRQAWRLAAMVSSDHLSESDGPELAALDPRVAPQAERRLGQYLASLAEESDLGQVGWRLRGRSAEIIQRYVHPSVLHSVIADPRLLLTGAHAAREHGCDLMPDEFVDAYVGADDIEGVIADHGLIEVDDGVNVRLRPVGDGLGWWRSLPENGATRAAPVLLVVADLSERDDARTALAAGALWDLLRNRIVRQSS